MDDLLYSLNNKKIYSSLNLFASYWQIKINEEDRYKLSFSFGGRKFKWNVLPFGYKNRSFIFSYALSLAMSEIIDDKLILFMDDLLKDQINWLGHQISETGYRPQFHKTIAME